MSKVWGKQKNQRIIRFMGWVAFATLFGLCTIGCRVTKWDIKVDRPDRTLFEPCNTFWVKGGNIMQYFGNVKEMTIDTLETPATSVKPESDFTGRKAFKCTADIGISFLNDALSETGIGGVDAGLIFNRTHTFKYSYQNVKNHYVSPASLRKYFGLTFPDPSVVTPKDHLAIITLVLRSNAISIEVFDETGVGDNVRVSALGKQIVAGGGSDIWSTNDNTIVYNDPDDSLGLPFRYQCVYLGVKRNSFILAPDFGMAVKEGPEPVLLDSAVLDKKKGFMYFVPTGTITVEK